MAYDPRVVKLAEPFAAKYVHQNPSGGGSYVAHHVVEQRLIATLGFPPDFALVEVLRGDVAGIVANPNGQSQRAKQGRPPLVGAVVGAVCRMTFDIGSRVITIEEVGDCEDPHNWDHDGARMKDAMSDAYKRCAMRAGCGLHLWSQGDYFLFDLLKSAGPTVGEETVTGPGNTGGGSSADAAKGSSRTNPAPASDGEPVRSGPAPSPQAETKPPSISAAGSSSGTPEGGDEPPSVTGKHAEGLVATAHDHTWQPLLTRPGYEMCESCRVARKAP